MATQAELEDAIRANPEDPAPYLVYADWLTGQGDPHGELISVQCALDGKIERPRRVELEAVRDRLERDIRARLLGGLDLYRDSVSLRWRWGFLHLAYAHFVGVPRYAEATDLMMTLGQSRASLALRELLLAPPPGEKYRRLIHAFRQMAGEVPLRRLALGLPKRDPRRSRRSPATAVDIYGSRFEGRLESLAEVLDAFPTLEELFVEAGNVHIGRDDGPFDSDHLREIKVRANNLDGDIARAIGNGNLPNLESVALAFGADSSAGVDDLAALLNRPEFPRLKALELTRIEFGGALCRALTKSNLVAQLERLKVMGRIYPGDLEHLRQHREAFAHLQLEVLAPSGDGDFAVFSRAAL